MIRPAGLAVAALLAAGSIVPSAPVVAAPPGDCPATMSPTEIESLAAGVLGTGYTVVRGDTPKAFGVEVLGVYPDGAGPGHDLIMIRVHDEGSSTFIKDAGGIWAGMSGSPVVIDGKIAGAISYGFSTGPSTFGGVTPITEMLRVANRPNMVAASRPLRLSAAAKRALRRVGASAASSFARLKLPVTTAVPSKIRTKGVSARKTARLRDRAQLSTVLRRAGFRVVGTKAVRSAKTSANGGPIGPGDDLAVTLATGDAVTAAVGTVTWTCEQNGGAVNQLLAFGHPMIGDGDSNLGAHQARAIDVVDDPVFGPFHFAVPGALLGRVVQDRLPGIGVRIGKDPVNPLQVTSTTTDGDDSRDGQSEIYAEAASFRSSLTALHARANVMAVKEADSEGSVSVTMHVTGKRDDGAPWEVTFGDRHIATEGPIGEFYTVGEAAEAVAGTYVAWLDMNGNEDVTIETVDMDLDLGAPARWVIEGIRARVGNGPFRPLGGQLAAKTGATVTVRFDLAKSTARGSWSRPGPNAERTTRDLVIKVPKSGDTISAGHGPGLGIFSLDPSEFDTFDALLRKLRTTIPTDELYVTIGSVTVRDQGLERIVDGSGARAKLVR